MRKIIWAVDAFEEKEGSPLEIAEIIGRFQKVDDRLSVVPVHVLGPTELSLSAEFPGPWVGQYLPSAEQALTRLVEELGLEGIERPEILTQTSASTSGAVDCLVACAKRHGADLIITGSHGRKGVSRWLMGSFSETLVLRSQVPVMVAGAHLRRDLDFGRILFPTDLGIHAQETLRRVTDFAQMMNARVTIYHALSQLAVPMYQSGAYLLGSPWVSLPTRGDLRDGLTRTQRHLEGWARWAGHHGVETDTIVDTEALRVSEAILVHARKLNAGWIAMASETGPILAAVMGSSARRVVRGAECPVWIMRTSGENANHRLGRAA